MQPEASPATGTQTSVMRNLSGLLLVVMTVITLHGTSIFSVAVAILHYRGERLVEVKIHYHNQWTRFCTDEIRLPSWPRHKEKLAHPEALHTATIRPHDSAIITIKTNTKLVTANSLPRHGYTRINVILRFAEVRDGRAFARLWTVESHHAKSKNDKSR